jgi:hypothetical protein
VPQEDFIARVWAAGQVASAKAALDLLKYRAERSEKNEAPWPEFAEYRCFACHASLTPEWKREPGYWGDRKVPGSFPFDPWYRAMLPALIARDRKAGYAELEAEMALPTPREETVKRLAKLLSNQHATWLKENLGKVDAATVRKGLVGLKDPGATWESATQFALAAAALKREDFHTYFKDRQKDPSAKKPEALKQIDDVLDALAFPDDSESPKGICGPYGLRKKFKATFATLLDVLKK